MKLRLHAHRGALPVLHLVFALTAVADVIIGPLLPSLSRAFQLSDGQSGVLLSAVFAGSAAGALLCRGNYARVMTCGLIALSVASAGFVWITRPLLYPWALFFGAGVGAAMTAVSLFAGRNYPERRTTTLTMLNFTWSLGALLAPLLAARLLSIASWRTVYLTLAGVAALAAFGVAVSIRDHEEEAVHSVETTGLRNLRLVALFAVFFFLQVGMESTFGAWISTYVLRTTHTTVSLAAAATAIYWGGFLTARGVSPWVLRHIRLERLLKFALLTALGAATLLVAAASPLLLDLAILVLGAALAPIFPLALAAFLDRARHSSDTRFVLAFSGFGGSVFPWLVGTVSAHTGSLRAGLVAGPVILLAMIVLLPALGIQTRRD